ncbi:VanZ family protein [Cohnella hashimotonis]|uniref:VanZ family protein n=1 Tax=Cohnella hashimotonis TaxID=2826895 RepID=A0ABT6TA11_9BACL|nr:VanZ family protein [Cohnella hashimotonis]
MINFDSIIFLTFLPVLIISIFVLKYKKKSFMYILFWSTLFLYFIFVIQYTLFPIPVNAQYLSVMREQISFSTNVNLFPLWVDSKFTLLTREHILNTFMGVPLGFLINYLKRRNILNIFFLGLAFGLGIEIIQLSISLILNYFYRIIDINDIFFNMSGVIIGYVLFVIVSLFYSKLIDEHFKHNKLTQFIYNASTGKQ